MSTAKSPVPESSRFATVHPPDLDTPTQGPPVETSKITLELLEGPHPPTRFEFTNPVTFLIGRAPDAHLQLAEDRHFSRHHLMLTINPPFCHLRDLGSRNGTWVNGNRVQDVELQDGDIISGGRTRLRILIQRPAETAGGPPSCVACGQSSQPDTVSSVAAAPSANSYLCPPCRRDAIDHPLPVPGYEIERKLGRGGMGVVYLARSTATNQPVALKLIVPESAASERSLQLFLREVSILSQLNHPRIVRFYEAGLSRGQFFFAMEYVDTVNLPELLTQQAPRTAVKLLCGVFCQTLEALHYAHAKAFVHRDIKPANILVSRSGNKLRTKLADFGLAKNFQSGGFSGMTHHGDICGSLSFMAPEQLLDCRAAKPAADIYSVAATLYYLLAKTTPHRFAPEKDPFTVVLEESVVPLGQRCPDLPAGLVTVINRALARQPEDRFGSASEMRRLLLPYAKGQAADV
jgi:serine/threonine-protein kinase